LNRHEVATVSTTLRIEPRWTDLDPVGHVNNNVFLVYAEEARARYLYAAIPGAWRTVVVVHSAIDYHSPVEQFESIDVTSTVTAVGTSSLTSRNVISTSDGRKCATVTTVQVVVNEDRTGSRPWTDEERTALNRLAKPDENRVVR
jgi:acyl-CoA thioester hydrolase